MIVNKYVLIFTSLFLFLSISVSLLLYKFFPLLIHHTIYYCREMIHSFSFQIPGGLGMFVFIAILVVLLITGVKLFLTFLHIYRFRTNLLKSVSLPLSLTSFLEKIHLQDKVVIVQNEKPFAFCFGIRHPKIYISTKLVALVTSSELKIILLHEKYHLEHHDALTLLVANIAASLFPFFPLLSDLIASYRTEREILADKAAVKGSSHAYLISIFKKLLQYEPDYTYSVIPAIADPQTIEARIRSLVQGINYQHTIVLKNVFVSLFSLSVIALFIMIPVNAVELHENGHDVMFFCLNSFSSPVQSSLI